MRRLLNGCSRPPVPAVSRLPRKQGINEKNKEIHRARSLLYAGSRRAAPADSHRTNEAINSRLRRAVSSPTTKTLPGREIVGGSVIALNHRARGARRSLRHKANSPANLHSFEAPASQGQLRTLRYCAKVLDHFLHSKICQTIFLQCFIYTIDVSHSQFYIHI